MEFGTRWDVSADFADFCRWTSAQTENLRKSAKSADQFWEGGAPEVKDLTRRESRTTFSLAGSVPPSTCTTQALLRGGLIFDESQIGPVAEFPGRFGGRVF